MNQPGGPVDPGYGVRSPVYNQWRGPYDNYHRTWANGYWHGYHANNNWGYGWVAAGTAAGVTAWALGSSIYSWGYSSYANPYYSAAAVAQPIVIEQPVAGGQTQAVTVPAYSYDYSQPIDTQSAPPSSEVANAAVVTFDTARDSFESGDYANALRLTDEALTSMPNDATMHEFRALDLFAAGQYELAAAPLHAVLSVGPGWDWTTLAGLYPDIEVYTAQLRKLEAYVAANPRSAAARFVLAYHYMTQGNVDAAVAQLKQVVALSPDDTLASQLIKQFSKPETGAEAAQTAAAPPPPPAAGSAPPVKPGSLPGDWVARPTPDTTIRLNVANDGAFTWKVESTKGKPQVLTGKWSMTEDLLTLAQSGQGGALVGRMTWKADDQWLFHAIGTGADDPGLTFSH